MPRLAIGCIRDLDDELGRTGELIKIARLHDAPDGGQEPFYCENVPAKVVLSQPQELIASGGLADSVVIISPTRLLARQWPVPPKRDDRIWVLLPDGRELTGNIESVVEQRVQGVVVRYAMKTRS